MISSSLREVVDSIYIIVDTANKFAMWKPDKEGVLCQG